MTERTMPKPARADLEKSIVLPQQEIDDLEYTWGLGDIDRAFQNLELERRRLERELAAANAGKDRVCAAHKGLMAEADKRLEEAEAELATVRNDKTTSSLGAPWQGG